MEAQFQTALDRLVETQTEANSLQVGNIDVTNVMSNKDGTAEHKPEDPNYYDDSTDPQEISANTSSNQEDTKILSKGIHNQTPNTEENLESWQTKICTNTANIKERHQSQQHYRRYLCYIS